MTQLKSLRLLLLVSVLFSALFLGFPGICTAQANGITVSFENKYGKTLYAGVMKYTGGITWLNFKTHKFQQFDPRDTLLVIPSSVAPTTFLYPASSDSYGANIYISEQPFTGQPDLMKYPHIYDYIETGWNPNGNAIWDVTSVDFIGIPMQITVGNTTVGYQSGVTRELILNVLGTALTQHPNIYPAKLFFKDQQDNLLRIFSPLKFYQQMTKGFECAIAKGGPALTGVGSISYSQYTFTDLKWIPPDTLTANYNGTKVTVSPINTSNTFGCYIPSKPERVYGAKVLAAMVVVAINRGVLDNPANWGIPSDYYQTTTLNCGQYNLYPKVLHPYSIDDKLYALAYDDYYNQGSTVPVWNTTKNATITILPKKAPVRIRRYEPKRTGK